MNKTIFIWIGVFGVTFTALFFLIRAQTKPPVEKAGNPEISVIRAQDWVFGNQDSGVVLVEYGDFQCPGCGQYEPIVRKVREDFKDKMVLVYRHFMFTQKHANAEPAAWAAEAAGKQGKFWEMHDLIFEKQKEWEASKDGAKIFEGYAQTLGLDLEQFKSDVASDDVRSRAKDSMATGQRFGVNATPTFFLNGKRIQPQNYDEFKTLIEATAVR